MIDYEEFRRMIRKAGQLSTGRLPETLLQDTFDTLDTDCVSVCCGDRATAVYDFLSFIFSMCSRAQPYFGLEGLMKLLSMLSTAAMLSALLQPC